MREFAIALAQRAGALALEFQTRGFTYNEIRTKAHHADLVTEADVAVEQLIVAAIRERYPDHAILAEENTGGGPPEAEWLWLIDPVDGTTNFAHGLPLFCVNLAATHRGALVLGVTCEPAAGRVYWAEAGAGAWLRTRETETRLSISRAPDLHRALLSTGFAHRQRESTSASLTEFAALDREAHAVRRLGSAALALAWVAAGRLDGYWEAELKPWDAAAGALLVNEAGGQATDEDGRAWQPESGYIVASNGQPEVHDAILATIGAVRGSVLYLTRLPA